MSFRPPRVYPLTDRRLAGGRSHAEQVAALIRSGLRLIQVRDKEATSGDLLADLDTAVDLCVEAGVTLLVNDRADLARLSGAGGVHLGEDDLSVEAARDLLGPAAIIGRSSHDVPSARYAESVGADYVAFGPIYPTATKDDARPASGPAGLREVCDAVRLPVVAIGGITLDRAAEVFAAGAASVAVISDLLGADDPEMRAAAWQAHWSDPHPPRGLLFLTGFMGAGKTTVGAILAERLGRRFVDLDREIERLLGSTVAEIFAGRGEDTFRSAENEILDAIPRGADAVVALGGGTLVRPDNADHVLGLGTVAWIDCELGEALARCGTTATRPVLGDPAAAEALAARLPAYRRAHLRVDSTESLPEELADQVLDRYL